MSGISVTGASDSTKKLVINSEYRDSGTRYAPRYTVRDNISFDFGSVGFCSLENFVFRVPSVMASHNRSGTCAYNGVDCTTAVFAAMSNFANCDMSGYYLYYFVKALMTAMTCTIYYLEPTTTNWLSFGDINATELLDNSSSTTKLYYKAIDSSNKIRLRIYPGTYALVMGGTWVKIFNLIPSSSISYTIAAGGYLEVTLMTEGITLVNVHANFGKCQLISKYNSYGFAASDILCSVPLYLGQNEIEQYVGPGLGSEIPYLNNSLSEIELYLSDEWFTVLTDLEPYHLTLVFSHQNKIQPSERNTTKRARHLLGEELDEK